MDKSNNKWALKRTIRMAGDCDVLKHVELFDSRKSAMAQSGEEQVKLYNAMTGRNDAEVIVNLGGLIIDAARVCSAKFVVRRAYRHEIDRYCEIAGVDYEEEAEDTEREDSYDTADDDDEDEVISVGEILQTTPGHAGPIPDAQCIEDTEDTEDE